MSAGNASVTATINSVAAIDGRTIRVSYTLSGDGSGTGSLVLDASTSQADITSALKAITAQNVTALNNAYTLNSALANTTVTT